MSSPLRAVSPGSTVASLAGNNSDEAALRVAPKQPHAQRRYKRSKQRVLRHFGRDNDDQETA